MNEPQPERARVVVNWRAVLLFSPLILAIPEAYGAYFGVFAVGLFIGVTAADMMDGRIKKRAARSPKSGPQPEQPSEQAALAKRASRALAYGPKAVIERAQG